MIMTILLNEIWKFIMICRTKFAILIKKLEKIWPVVSKSMKKSVVKLM